MTPLARSVLVVGLGNPARGDDAVGGAVVRRIAPRLPAGVDIIERADDPMSLIEDWAGYPALVVVDAAAPAGEPGRVVRFDLCETDLPAAVGVASSHAFGLAEAVAMARALGTAPGTIIVYGVEGADFDTGAAMTPRVAAAVDGVADAVLNELDGLQQRFREDTHA